ncbi:Microcin E492 immunity protein [Xenorhabdus sp. KK7.4]|nr:Microcin E492 immunity protein [Xenorhabdus sp. KK7.4]
MSFYCFASSPIYISALGFIIYIHGHVKKDGFRKQINNLLFFSILTCLLYPLVSIFILNDYNMFDDFIFFYIASSILSIAINAIILYIYRKVKK